MDSLSAVNEALPLYPVLYSKSVIQKNDKCKFYTHFEYSYKNQYSFMSSEILL